MFASGLFAVAIVVISVLESQAGFIGWPTSFTITPPVNSLTEPSPVEHKVFDTTTPAVVAGNKQQIPRGGSRLRPQNGRKRRQNSARINGPGCSGVSCKPDEVCVSKSKFRQQTTSCISNDLAQLIVSRRERNKDKTQGNIERKYAAQWTRESRQLDEQIQQIKAQAQQFELDRERKLQKRLELISAAVTFTPSSNETFVTDVLQNDAPETTPRPLDCYRKGLESIGERLLDEFKREKDEEHNGQEKHRKEKRNSTKKELHEDDECICQPSVNWKFQRLDADFDGRLSTGELSILHENRSVDTHCLTTFVKSCDYDSDAMLSEKEWCCCFSYILPPCLSAMKTIPTVLIRGEASIVTGWFVPQCDDEGFYKPIQCDSNDGRCWCSDRNGTKIKDLSSDGNTDC